VYCKKLNTDLGTVERSRAAQVGEHIANSAQHKLKCARSKLGNAVQDTGRRRSQELEDEAEDLGSVHASAKLAVFDGGEVEGVEFARGSVAAEQDWVLVVHADDGIHFVDYAVGPDTIDVALGDCLVVSVNPGAIWLLVGAEEGGDSLDVGDVVLLTVGVQLGEESGISVQKETSRAEEELQMWC
jgi:hypothetical protein